DGAERMPKREAMALGLDGDALDRGRDAGSGQRLPTTEGSQAASNVAGRSGSSPQQRLTRCPCSPSHRRLTSISAATASQCSTKRRDTPLQIVEADRQLTRRYVASGPHCLVITKRQDVKRSGIRARGDMIGIPLLNMLDRWASHTGVP